MLCCWLQQLQEFGGPEVDKPDLLKGSIGSLKNFGMANATTSNASVSTTVTSSTAAAPAVLPMTSAALPAPSQPTPAVASTAAVKQNSTATASGSIVKHNSCIDRRARYNVCIAISHHIRSECTRRPPEAQMSLIWKILTVCAQYVNGVPFAKVEFMGFMMCNVECVSPAKKKSARSHPIRITYVLRANFVVVVVLRMRCLQGDLVQLKEMPSGVSNELKGKALDHLMMAHGLRHENINPFIGKLATILRTSALSGFFVCSFLHGWSHQIHSQ